MVSHSSRIIFHHGHELKFQLTTKHIKIRRSLENIATIEQKHILFHASNLLYQSSSPRKSSLIRISAVPLLERLYPAVLVIGMKNGNFFRRIFRIKCLC